MFGEQMMNPADAPPKAHKGDDPELKAFGARVAELLEGVSLRAFARAAGVNEKSLRQYANGTEPLRKALIGMARAGGVSLEWLATGEGPKFPGCSFPSDEFVLIPVYDVEASAGHGAALTDERIVNRVMFRKDFLAQERLNPASLGMISARGDSMPISAPDGALLLVDTSVRRVVDSAIYVLRLDHQLLVKRLQRFVDGAIDVISENPAYRTERIEPARVGDLDVVGQVKLSSHRV